MPPAKQSRQLPAVIHAITPEILLLSINQLRIAAREAEAAEEVAEPLPPAAPVERG